MIIVIDLREELSKHELPNIYVYQEDNHDPLFRHIIVPDRIVTASFTEDGMAIFPLYILDSNREFRHFYNKTSFKYLEELSIDRSYNLENKRFGKVIIKKM